MNFPHRPGSAVPSVQGDRTAGEGSAEIRAPDFSLRQLSYFVAVARHQSLHKAADALHVSAPAVSAAIAHLEATLNVQLFQRRHARGLVLTEAGSAFAVECRNLLQQAWELGSGRLMDQHEIQGHVHLACLFSFAPFVIPPLMRQFADRFPKARMFWHEGHHEYLLEGLQTGAFDLALMYDFEVPSGIECIVLRPAPLQVVLPAGHALLRRPKLTVRELATEPLILLDLPRTRNYMLSAFSADGVAPRIAHRVYSMTMLLGLVANGHGFSLLNFCPPNTHSRELESTLRTPNLVLAHSHRYRFTRAAAAVVEIVTTLVDDLAFTAS